MMPTETELDAMVRHNDPAAMRWFGALLENTLYAPAQRTQEQNDLDAAIKSSWPAFAIQESSDAADADKACMWDIVKERRGSHFTPYFQETGSCVGNGLGQAVNYLMAVDAWVRNDPEEVKFPTFYLYPYGRSRVYANLRGPGEGSFGSAAAKAIKNDGIFASDLPGLPASTVKNGGVTWGRALELEWSWSPDGGALKNKWGPEAIKHPVQTVAQARSADDVAAGLRNGYPSTCASMWGGNMRCTVQNGVLLNRKTTQWAHQMCVLGWWRHPQLGEIFWIQNSWGNPHGDCPSGAPPGGFWVLKADMDWICRTGEVYVLSQFQGFPSQTRVLKRWRDLV